MNPITSWFSQVQKGDLLKSKIRISMFLSYPLSVHFFLIQASLIKLNSVHPVLYGIVDVCDGNVFRTHPLFSSDPSALQIIAFFDELELCNPPGTHVKKHKLAIVLFTLGNIHPKYRSSLRVIHLLIAATVPVVEKYGLDEILQPFIRDLRILATEGVTFTKMVLNEPFEEGFCYF